MAARRRLPSQLRALAPAAWILVGAGALWLAFGHGFANYDTFYALVWGDEILAGAKPDYGAPIPPTPHPLATLAGVLLAPFGDGAEPIAVAIAYLSLAALAYRTARLGQLWFGAPAGLLAAAIVLSREPVLSNGVRAYVDIPYVALVLAALVVETRRPRAGWPVLALLARAGLLRPEAWLFSAAYVAYLAWARFGRRPVGALREPAFLGLVGLAAAAPLLWLLYDLVLAGDALYSLTGTRETVETLGRDTGLWDWIRFFPRRLGEILREPVLVGAAGGGVLSLWLLRERSRLGAVAGVLAAAAFALLAIAGLAVITRYAMLAAVILAIFCGAGAFGWMRLAEDNPWRRRWAGFAALVGVLLVVFAPAQIDRLTRLQDTIAIQEEIRDDLHDIAGSGEIDPACEPVTVPNHRPVPLLALWLDRRPSEIVTAVREQDGELVRTRTRSGYFFDPATPSVEANFTLDPNDPGELTAPVPEGFERVASNASWLLYARC